MSEAGRQWGEDLTVERTGAPKAEMDGMVRVAGMVGRQDSDGVDETTETEEEENEAHGRLRVQGVGVGNISQGNREAVEEAEEVERRENRESKRGENIWIPVEKEDHDEIDGGNPRPTFSFESPRTYHFPFFWEYSFRAGLHRVDP